MPENNGPNKCQGAIHGMGHYDCSCPVITSSGAQCRTMLSQRPCGSSQCTREECSRARLSASVFESNPVRVHAACGKAHSVYDTTCDTENGVTGSQSVPQTEGDTEPTYTLTGLSVRDVERLEQALRMLRRTYTRESVMYQEVSELGARVSALTWDN